MLQHSSIQPKNSYSPRRAFSGVLSRVAVSGVIVIGLFWLLLATYPTAALAHPLDEYYQVTYILVAPARVTLKIELYPGVLVAPQLLNFVDADRNDDISTAEARAS